MICQFCKSEIPDTQPFNFCPMCGQTIMTSQQSAKDADRLVLNKRFM